MRAPKNIDFSRVADTPECWAELRIFLSVARLGSFSAAGEALGLSTNSVARACARIQDLCNDVLYVVSPRGATLTDSGKKAFEYCVSIERDVVALFSSIKRPQSRKLHGSLRISVPEGISGAVVGPNIYNFIDMYPDVELDVVNPASFKGSDVVDIAITFDNLDAQYKYKNIGRLWLLPIASTLYLNRADLPSLSSPDGHHFVQCSYFTSLVFSPWNHLRSFGKTVLTCESSLSYATSIIAGAGIGLLANYTLIDRRLVPINMGEKISIPIYVGTLRSREKKSVVRAGEAWLENLIANHYDWFQDKTSLPSGVSSLDLGPNILNPMIEQDS